MKYLFLCAVGINRSPTAARIAYVIAKERGLDVQTFYGGIDSLLNAHDKTAFMQGKDPKAHFEQYDRIFVMEKYMKDGLEKTIGVEPQKIVCLHIPDEYLRDDMELVKILRNNLGIFI
ncbi:hypothetical protein J4429_04945 [Candidatus Pacearchaeota archaeon]|nr:hypothetical protein [Candidatus Pacearchaeota archaeon]